MAKTEVKPVVRETEDTRLADLNARTAAKLAEHQGDAVAAAAIQKEAGDEKLAIVADEQKKREEISRAKAEIDQHPTNRMKKLVHDLQASQRGDINDRVGALQRAVLGLMQLLLLTAPEGPVYKDPNDPVVEAVNGKQ